MADPQIDWPDLSSDLVYFPDHVHAIGMMVVEMTSMEVMLGDVLAALLDLDADAAHQLYFTPKATIARLDMLLNVVETHAFDKLPTVRASIKNLTHRSKALMDKRHKIIHAHWLVSGDARLVGRLQPPFDHQNGPDEEALEDLKRLVSDIRQLTHDARHLCDQIAETMRPETWLEIRAQSVLTAETLRQDILRLQAQIRARKDPPEPSPA
jgi:hypothetical protein